MERRRGPWPLRITRVRMPSTSVIVRISGARKTKVEDTAFSPSIIVVTQMAENEPA